MKTNTLVSNYKDFRFPPAIIIISHAVWLYFHFSLSFRDVEELLAQREIVVTYEKVLLFYSFLLLLSAEIVPYEIILE